DEVADRGLGADQAALSDADQLAPLIDAGAAAVAGVGRRGGLDNAAADLKRQVVAGGGVGLLVDLADAAGRVDEDRAAAAGVADGVQVVALAGLLLGERDGIDAVGDAVELDQGAIVGAVVGQDLALDDVIGSSELGVDLLFGDHLALGVVDGEQD